MPPANEPPPAAMPPSTSEPTPAVTTEAELSHTMSLYVAPSVAIDISVSHEPEPLYGARGTGTYTVTGPPRAWYMLEQACGVMQGKETLHVRGNLSDLQPMTLPQATHAAAGVAPHTAYFAFCYPAHFAIAPIVQSHDPFPASFYESLGFVRVGPVAWKLAARHSKPRKPAKLAPLSSVSRGQSWEKQQQEQQQEEDAETTPASSRGTTPRGAPQTAAAAAAASAAGLATAHAEPSSPHATRETTASPTPTSLLSSPSSPPLVFSSMEKRLAVLNLADETWAFLLLVGGFAFFDADRKLLAVSALTLVPSIWQLHFDGPFEPSAAAFTGMKDEGRMEAVTLDALEDAGFVAFGWAHTGASPGGHQLCQQHDHEEPPKQVGARLAAPHAAAAAPASTPASDAAASDATRSHPARIEHGAFVYEMRGSETSYFRLSPHTPDELAKFRTEAKLLQGHIERAHEESGEKSPDGRHPHRFEHRLSAAAFTMPPLTAKEIVEGKVLSSALESAFTLGKRSGFALKDTLMNAQGAAQRAIQTTQRETAEMRKLTQELGDVEGLKLASRWWLQLLRVSLVCLGALPILAALVALAYVDGFAFELLACFVWNACNMWVAWVPLRDTSAIAIRYKFRFTSSSSAIVRFLNLASIQLVQYSTPPVVTLLYSLSLTSFGRLNASTLTDAVTKGVVNVALPLLVYQLRRRLGRSAAASAKAAEESSSNLTHQLSTAKIHPAEAPAPPPKSTPPKSTPPTTPPPTTPPPAPRGGDGAGEKKRSIVVASFDTQLEAATRLQAQMRSKRDRRLVRNELIDRKRRMRQFSWPMLIATVVDLVGNSVVSDLIYRPGRNGSPVLGEAASVWSLLFALPGIALLLRDLRSDDRPRFSLAHGIFFVGVLFRVGMKAVVIDKFVWDYLTATLSANAETAARLSGLELDSIAASVDVGVSLLTMSAHILIFMVVTTFGKLSLNLVATPNACPHLLFPFQFFDFVFLYSFFNLRSIGSITLSWVLMQIVLQTNVILRNSGTTDALMQRYLRRTFNLLLCQTKHDKLREFDPNADPLIRLQFLARVGWQYDLADVTALVATPTIVSLLVWRDGLYTLEGTEILVRACELGNVWLRFGLMLVIKPAASTIARCWLRRKMRKTLLGKRTMHGTSRIAAQIVSERKLRMGAARRRQQQRNVDEKVVDHFDFREEELAAVREELSFSTLNFAVLRAKSMKKWRYYLAVVVLQLFSAFPCRRSIPNGVLARWDAPPLVGHANASAGISAEGAASRGTGTGSMRVVAVEMEAMPLSSCWYYVPPELASKLSLRLSDTLTRTAHPNASSTLECAAGSGESAYAGWFARWAEPGKSRSDAAEVALADAVLNTDEDGMLIQQRLQSPTWQLWAVPANVSTRPAQPPEEWVIHTVMGALTLGAVGSSVLLLLCVIGRRLLSALKTPKVAPNSRQM